MFRIISGSIIIILLLFSVFGDAERVAEWFEVNLFTVSTKAKQQKLVEFTEERVFEAVQGELDEKTVEYYQQDLSRAEDMTEKILFLDGRETPLAELFERVTFDQERALGDLLIGSSSDKQSLIFEVLTHARQQNRKMFEYLVVNYQFNEQDIEKHVAIVRRHLLYIVRELEVREPSFAKASEDMLKILQNLEEAEEHLADGLNIGAYARVDQVKDIFYAKLFSK